MKKDKFITDFEDIPGSRQKMPHLSLDDRKLSFDEVEQGFIEEIALNEVTRCLSCRRCIGCGLCLAECDQQAIVYDQTSQNKKIEVDSIVVANGAESFDARRKPEFGYSKFPNVVTNIELERILNANGPFGGILMRPSDGDIPQKMAFIQCVGSRDESIGASYCSNICCTTALKQSMTAMDKIENLEVTIFYTDIRPYSKNSENYYLRAKNEYNIKFIQAKVEAVDGFEENDNLVVKFQKNKKSENLAFDLIVLSTGIAPSKYTKGLSRKVGIRLNKYGFFPGTGEMPVPTSGEDVWFAGSMTQPTDISNSLTQASAVAAKVLQSMKQKELNLKVESNGQVKKKIENFTRTGIFFCRYGLNTQITGNSNELIKSISKANPEIFVDELEYCCNITGKRIISETIEKEKLGKIIIAPCFSKAQSGLFSRLVESTGLSSESISIFEIDGHNGGLNVNEAEKKLITLIKEESEKKQPTKTGKKIVREACVYGNSIAALQTSLEIATLEIPVNLFFSEKMIDFKTGEIFFHNDKVGEIANQLTEQVKKNPKIKIHPEAELVKLKGQAGNFNLMMKENGQDGSYSTGAVILATGAEPYQPEEFLYTQNENVITQFELNQLLTEKDFKFNNIVMIQCVGSRGKDRTYCSRICCEGAINNGLIIKEVKPDAEILFLHRDVRTYDFAEDNYEEAVERGIQFIRMDKYPEVKVEKNKLKVEVLDRQSGETVQLNPDLIVLSNGIIPDANNKKFAELLKVQISNNGFFQEVDPTFNPLELEQKGIFVAGLAHSPQRLENILTQAVAVAGKVGMMINSQ
ncbi:FAD-dependent oxidoreductase [candidate division KSB1 bacterium]|nr:FAD-dependent oxidoreductase [candidate division KSB1 bacterium]